MQVIAAYMLVVAYFLSLLFERIKPTSSVANKFLLLAVLVSIPAIYMGACVLHGISRGVFFVLLFASMPAAELTARAIRRRRTTIPPRLRVRGANYNVPALVTGMLLLVIAQSVIFAIVIEDRWTYVIPLVLVMNSYPAYFIVSKLARSEIYGNGIWFGGELFTWDKFDCFTWTMKDSKAVVEFGIGGKKPRQMDHPLRLTVPPENVQVARQLLEENLPNLSVAPLEGLQ
jgi:hypothetical protein